jgi:hypothetical protein
MRSRVLTTAWLLALAALLAAAAGAAAAPISHKSSTNPKDVFATAMRDNIYQTPNYFIGAYHYIQCWANKLIEPANTKETAQAVAFYYNRTLAGQPVTFRTSRPMFHTSTK